MYCQLTLGSAKGAEVKVQNNVFGTHQRFVKTTPNPNATKNRRGELVGPGLPPPWALGLDVAEAVAEVELGVDIVMIYFPLPFGLMLADYTIKPSTTVCRWLQKKWPSRWDGNCSRLPAFSSSNFELE